MDNRSLQQSPLLSGVWLPLVTPFRDRALDEASLERLAGRYMQTSIAGFVIAATTGEGPTLEMGEARRLAEIVAAAAHGRPILLGLSGSDTHKLTGTLRCIASWPVDGYLVASPYYSRPSQDGLLQHFLALADRAARPIVLYNIPYRTGVNLKNETLFRLAEHPNIIGVKDCCGDAAQSFDLLRGRPPGFAVLTGEDALFYDAIAQGADGGILASAHVDPEAFSAVRDGLLAGSRIDALARWHQLVDLARILFAEPNPAPVKHWLWRSGLIASPELRLPMTLVSAALADRLDILLTEHRPAAV
jgi:4-hydroxy-tetrahydrodipicolinate synthase